MFGWLKKKKEVKTSEKVPEITPVVNLEKFLSLAGLLSQNNSGVEKVLKSYIFDEYDAFIEKEVAEYGEENNLAEIELGTPTDIVLREILGFLGYLGMSDHKFPFEDILFNQIGPLKAYNIDKSIYDEIPEDYYQVFSGNKVNCPKCNNMYPYEEGQDVCNSGFNRFDLKNLVEC